MSTPLELDKIKKWKVEFYGGYIIYRRSKKLHTADDVVRYIKSRRIAWDTFTVSGMYRGVETKPLAKSEGEIFYTIQYLTV